MSLVDVDFLTVAGISAMMMWLDVEHHYHLNIEGWHTPNASKPA
jgi:hypothetical protein